MSLSKLVIELSLLDGAGAGLRAFTRQLAAAGGEGEALGKKLNTALNQVESGLKALSVSKALKESLVDPGLEAASTLQEAMAQLEVAISPGSVRDMRATLNEASQVALQVAGPTPFSPVEVLGIQADLVKAGLDAQTAFSASRSVANLATVGRSEGLDTAGASKAVITMATLWNAKTEDDFARLSDLLSRAADGANTTVGAIGEALGNAQNLGATNPAEALALIGVLGNMGVQSAEAGTAVKIFRQRLAEVEGKGGLNFFDAKGQFLGMANASKELREKFAKLNPQQQDKVYKDLFGEGERAARALARVGDGSLEDVLAQMDGGRNLDAKVALLASGYGATMDALKGNLSGALATAFTPALQPLTNAANLLSSAAMELNAFFTDHEGAAQAVSYGALLAAAGAATFGGVQVLRGGAGLAGALGQAGSNGLLGKLLGQAAGEAAGIAKGKAVEAATGVQAVYVTNWPASGVGGGPAAAGATAAGAAGGWARWRIWPRPASPTCCASA